MNLQGDCKMSRVLATYQPDVKKAKNNIILSFSFGVLSFLPLTFFVLLDDEWDFFDYFALLIPVTLILLVVNARTTLKRMTGPLNQLEVREEGLYLASPARSGTFDFGQISYVKVQGPNIFVVFADGKRAAFMFASNAAQIADVFNRAKNGDFSGGQHSASVSAGVQQFVPSSTMSVLALVFSFLVPIVGLILGFVAKREILMSNGKLGGLGLAQAAIVISLVFSFLVTLALIVWFAIFLS
jgi:hypothetical protein